MSAKIFSFFDFLPGFKTKGGVVIYIIGHLAMILTFVGVNSQWASALGSIVSAIGAIVSTYGVVLAGLRNVPFFTPQTKNA